MPPQFVQSRRPLDRHQVIGKMFISQLNNRAGLFMRPGTGKTLTAIRAFEHLTPILLILRRDDVLTWKLELERDNIKGFRFIDDFRESLPIPKPVDWLAVTYDLLKSDDVFKWVSESKFKAVIADELHMIKRWDSSRTKEVVRATSHIPCRLGLTGTPITNELEDVFSEALFIDGGKAFGTHHRSFMHKYYVKSGYGWYARRTAKEEIANKLKEFAYVVHEDDVLNLPKKYSVIKSAPMGGMQKRYFNQVMNEWELTLQSGETIDIDHVIVQIEKLRQISGGFYYEPDKSWVELRCPKLDMLMEMVTDGVLAAKKKIVVWSNYTAEIERIHRTMTETGISAVMFRGSKRSEKEAARSKFATDPKCRVFIGQVDSGVGMNELVCADSAVYYSNSRKVVSRDQSMARTRRRGSEVHDSITYYDLVTEGGSDLALIDAVNQKMDIASVILTEIKNRRFDRSFFGRSAVSTQSPSGS